MKINFKILKKKYLCPTLNFTTMKFALKITLLLSMTTLFSCSNNDTPDTPSTANTLILPKKITEINYNGGAVYTYVNTFVFENNILKSSSYGTDRRYDFVYNGDKVVEMKKYVAGVASGSSVFYYTGDKLDYILNNSESTKTEFSYNGNVLNRITYKSIVGTVEKIDQQNDITFNAANNVSQLIRTSFFNGNSFTNKEIPLYDTKNNYSTNFNKYIKLITGISGLNSNNKISSIEYSPSTNTTPSSQRNFSITYNSNNYPTKIIETNTTTGTIVSDTTIEYY
jgi:hypothetical protein